MDIIMEPFIHSNNGFNEKNIVDGTGIKIVQGFSVSSTFRNFCLASCRNVQRSTS